MSAVPKDRGPPPACRASPSICLPGCCTASPQPRVSVALVCRKFAALRFRAAALSARSSAEVPGPLLADQLQVYQGPTSLKLSSHSVQDLRALWRDLAVQGPVLSALHVHHPKDTCVECEGECPDSHRPRVSQLCARSGQASAWWAFSNPFLRAHLGLRSLRIHGCDRHWTTCTSCCVCCRGPDSAVSVPELRSSLSRLRQLTLDNVNLGWPQDWPSALPSLKALSPGLQGCPDNDACAFPWSILVMTGLTSLCLRVDLPAILDQDFGRLSKLRTLSLALSRSVMNDGDGFMPPVSTWGLRGLRSLSLRNMGHISEVRLGRLVGLTELVLRDAGLQSLPCSLGALQIVKMNNIIGLAGLQESIGRHEALRTLSFERCTSVSSLPSDFDQLASLKDLFLSDLDSLVQLPENFGRLQSLQDLTLNYCRRLRKLPADFGFLASLTALSFDLFSLEELPEGFGRLHALRIVERRSCQSLRRIPTDFGQLPSLTDLKLSDLKVLEELPEISMSLGQLRSLELARLTSLRGSRMPGLVIDSLHADKSHPSEELAGLRGFACLEIS